MIDKKSIMVKSISLDDSAQSSLDFIVGLSIFLIAFAIVATMTSALLIGLQSKTIDFDAVAYRTGVILVEDPGEIDETVGISYIAPDRYSWDLIYPEYYNQYHESNTLRMGLMLPRYYYDTPPRVLMSHKITQFFNSTNYDQDFYKDKIIFGDYPYQFNISFMMLDGSNPVYVGSQIPDNTSTGYIRRVVLVKKTTGLTLTNLPVKNESGKITVTYSFRNISQGDPAYMIYPAVEQTVINLKGINGSDTYHMTYLQVCSPTCEDPEPDSPTILLKNYDDPNYVKRFPDIGVAMDEPVNNRTYIEIEPGYFTRRYFPNIGPVDSIDVKMTIRNLTNGTYLVGDYGYDYNPDITTSEFDRTVLTPAVLEVRIW